MSLPTQLEIVDGREAGDWIESELSGSAGSVGAQVPGRYKAYVRILHPPHDLTGRRVTWAKVAEDLGRTAHPLAQWLARWILEDRRLEAFPVEPCDLLTWNADKINPPLPR
jgi:hypothetical protein